MSAAGPTAGRAAGGLAWPRGSRSPTGKALLPVSASKGSAPAGWLWGPAAKGPLEARLLTPVPLPVQPQCLQQSDERTWPALRGPLKSRVYHLMLLFLAALPSVPEPLLGSDFWVRLHKLQAS